MDVPLPQLMKDMVEVVTSCSPGVFLRFYVNRTWALLSRLFPQCLQDEFFFQWRSVKVFVHGFEVTAGVASRLLYVHRSGLRLN